MKSRYTGSHVVMFFFYAFFCFLTALLPCFQNGHADTNVSGVISTDTTWNAAGSPYIVTGTVTVRGTDGADEVTTLIIEPGVEVRFNRYRYIDIGANSGDPGALIALGTAAAPVVFTSSQAAPAAGDWYGIRFYNTTHDAASKLEHCIVEYAGYNNSRAVTIDNAAPALLSCRFADNSAYDLYYYGAVGGSVTNSTFNHGINFAGSGQVTFSGNTVNWNTSYPVRLPADNVSAFVADTSFTNLDAASSLEVTGSTLTRDAVWKATIAYAPTSSLRVQGTDGADGVTCLTLEPGAVLRMNARCYLYIGSSSGDPGALAAVGTEAAPIRFTANTADPSPGYWYGIQFQNTTHDAISKLEHCIVEYAGYYNTPAVTIGNAAPALVSCRFANNSAYDLYYSGAVGGSVTSSTFNHGINLAGSGQVAFSGNTVNWNTSYPVRLPADNVSAFVADTSFSNLDAASALEVTGSTLTRDAVWKATIAYAPTSSLRVQGTDGADGVTCLTLEPGAVLRMNARCYLYIGSSSGDPGALAAVGTEAAPIRFTANTADPSPGYWYGIQFQNTTHDATSKLEHCIVEYAGYYNTPAVTIDNAAPELVSCRFADNSAYDLSYTGAVGGSVTSSTFNHGINFTGSGQVAFSGNTVNWNTSYPVRLPADNVSAFVADTSFSNLDAASALEVTGSTLTRDAVWKATIAYAPTSSLRVQGTDGADGVTCLTLEPGVELRMSAHRYLYIGYSSGDPGALSAVGTEAAPIRFTANSTTPSSGFWYGIRLENTADDALSKLEHCIVEYGGYYNQADVSIDRCAPLIRYCTIRNSGRYGIYVYGSESNQAIIECNNIKDNAVGIYTSNNAQPAIGGNNFINNLEYGVYNASSVPVSAINNWWGDAGGPNLAGDQLYGNVVYEPWRNAPSDCVTGVPVNDPPLAAQNPTPADGATGVQFPNGALSLTWSGGDPNPSDTPTYDVMWGTDSADLTPVAQDLAEKSFNVTGITPHTTYYWQVVTHDNHGAETSGPVWRFTTIDAQPDLVVSSLSWTPAADIVAGQQVTFTATIHNSGAGATSANFGVAFQINSLRSTRWVSQQVPAGQSVQVTYQWTAQVGGAAISVEADSTGAIAEDNENNNTYSADLGTIPDTTPPELTSTSPAAGASLQQVNQIDIYLADRFGGSMDNTATQASISVTVDGAQPVSGSTSVSGNRFTFTPAAAPLAEGSYQVSLTAHDTAGNSQPYSFAFTVDNQVPAKPAITGGSVTSGTIQVRPVQNRSNKSSVTLTGTREDNSGIVINNSWQVAIGSGPWTTTFGCAQGENALEIRARDAAGNLSEAVWVDIQVDSVAPVAGAMVPAAGSFVNTVPAAMTIPFTETGSGLDQAASTLSIKDGGLNPVGGQWAVSSNQLIFTPAAPFADATYTVQVRLVDQMGNASPAGQSVFTVDTTAPPKPLVNPVTSPTHTLTQVISGQKEAYAAIVLDGQQIIDHTAQTTWQHTVSLASGENQYHFIARDRAGNQSDTVQVTIEYDDIAPPPVTTLTASGEGSGTSVLLNWNGYNAAAHGDIQVYRIYYENAAFTDVSALTVKATVGAGSYTCVVQELTAGATYWFAVVAVDRMGNFNPAVTPVAAVPTDTLAPGEITHLAVQSFADRLIFTWQAPTSNADDLAAYKVYFNGASAEQLAADTTTFERSGLSASGAYPLRITTCDSQDNESSGVSLTGYTWLDNPAGLAADPFSGYVQLSWSPVTPAGHLKHYAVYVSPSAAFTSVQGMTPAVTTTGTQAKVAGLTDHQTYHFAVTAVNRSGGQRPDVTSVPAEPTPDQDGPQISNVLIDGQPLLSGHSLDQPAVVTLDATDPSGVSRIEFQLDGAPWHIDYNAPYSCVLDILQIADGAHTLDIQAFDTLNNSAALTFSLEVGLAPPPAPQITSPADGLITNQPELSVQGRAAQQSSVQLYVNSQAVGAPAAVDAQGRFTLACTLAEGSNQIQASAANRAGSGPLSPAIQVTLDSTRPQPPAQVSAQAIEQGAIRLTWQAPTGKTVSSYILYRSQAPFDDPAAAEQGATIPTTASGYRDLPPSDGTWYYRMTSQDSAGNQSDPSNPVSAVSDSVAPKVTAIDYSPQGNVDPLTGAMAPGRVDLTLTVSEPLMALPFFSITPEGGVPISVNLQQNSATGYSGFFIIEQTTPSGTAYAIFSGRDQVGNRGTEIDQGLSFAIDTDGPAVRRLEIAPATPIRNDAQDPLTVTVTIGLNEATAPASGPDLAYLLSAPGRGPVSIANLVEIAPAAGDAQTWQGSFILPADAGQAEVETLQFAHQCRDSLGNIGERILAENRFQVYQGDLPPLAAPSGLSATALPGGRIELVWNPVEQAVGYNLYRQAPDQTELSLLTRIDGSTSFVDATEQDGTYTYAVTSLRSENDQLAESGQSAPVSVQADSVPPAAPQNLTLQLIPLGIEASFEHEATEPVSFRLYRSDALQITSVAGLEQLACHFNQNKALDRNPSPSDHSYAVTAVDQTGNESAPSNSAYLNFDLLPVSSLSVEQIDLNPPQLLWTHPGGDVAGYDVYMGPAGQPVKVNIDPVTVLSMADSGYADDVRDYSVIAVDSNAAQSPARSIRLPKLSAQLADNSKLLRGIMNQLTYTVTNWSDQPADDLQVIARVIGIEHPSARFALAAHQSLDVPVTVAGYAELSDAEPLTTSVQMNPNPGETARITRSSEILVEEGMLALQIYTETFVRGGTGKVWFTLENTGQAEIQIVTAQKHGSQASGEITLTLADSDGNMLSTVNFKQSLGPNVFTLAGGQTVARIGAGAVFESAPVQIPVPANAPDEPTLRLAIENIYHRLGQDDQLRMRGLSGSRNVRISQTPYNGTIDSISPQVTTGVQDIRITGSAVLRDSGQAVPNAPLNLVISLNGFERKIELITDTSGSFTHTFTPLAGETGTYKVAALHPDLLDRPVQATFAVTGIDISPARIRLSMPKNYQQTIPIEVSAKAATTAHNLRLAYDDWDQPANAFAQGVTYTLGESIAELAEGQKATINLAIASDNTAADSGSLVLRLVSDETAVQPWGFVRVDLQLTQAEPFLAATPHFIETGVLLGDMVSETITLENKGLADLEGITLSLIGENHAPVPDWVVLNAAADLGTLTVGQMREVPIGFAPPDTAAEGFYTVYLRVTAADYPTMDIPLYISATPSGIGNALFKVKDIFTGTLNERNELIQGLSGARITLQNEKNATIVYNQSTDDLGEALFANLSAGIYKYRIQAAGHQEKIGRLWVKPGLTTSQELYLEYNFVTVEWQVVETTIQDKYEIVLNITYETDVPAPVVVCEPASVSLPDLKAGDVLNGEFTLTNHGLIRADNLKINLPEDDAYIRYELLAPVPESLGAKERINVPYRLTCIQSLDQTEQIQSGGAGGCYRSCASTEYSGITANGCPYSGSVPHCFGRPCSGTSDTSGGGGGGLWFVTSCGGTGCGGGRYYAPEGPGGGGYLGAGVGEPCTPGPELPPRCGTGACEKETKQQTCQKCGSSAQLLGRTYTDDITDLSVKVPGGSIDIRRSFYNDGPRFYRDSWHFQHARTLEFDVHVWSLSAGSSAGSSSSGGSSSAARPIDTLVTGADGSTITLKPIKREGIWFKPDASKSTIDLSAGEALILRPEDAPERIVYLGGDVWRWEDKYGNWETYEYAFGNLNGVQVSAVTFITFTRARQARLLAYGDREGVIARVIYNENNVLTGIADRNDRQVIWIDYAATDTGRTLVVIRDLNDRRLEYEITSSSSNACMSIPQKLIHRFKDANGHETFYFYGPVAPFRWSEPASTGIKASSSGGGGGGGNSSCSPPPRQGLIGVLDPAGRTKTITYGENGALASVLDHNGNGYYFEYSYNKDTLEYYAQVRATTGAVKEVWIDAQAEATRVALNGRTVKRYEKNGNEYTITDENGNQTIKTYDAWDNLTQVVYPDGATVKYTYDPALNKVTKKIDENNVVTRYLYDEAGRLVRRIEAKDTADERITDFDYDTGGNLVQIRRHADAQTAEAVTAMTYDGQGNMETLTDPEGHVTAFAYDVSGNVLTKTDPRGKTWTYTYDATGRLKTITDPLEHVTEYVYDELGNKIREIDPAGRQTLYEYDARDNLKKAVNPALEETLIENTFDGRVLAQTDGEGRKVQYQYDADGRLAAHIDGNGNRIGLAYGTDTGGCTSCGNSGSTDQPARIDFPTFARELQYDGRGRKFAERDLGDDGTEQLTRYTYDGAGNLTSKTDAEGNVTTYTYDPLNRLVNVTDANGGQTAYAYDNRDNLISLTDAENQTTRFEYDKNNRLVKEIRPLGEQTRYGYDSAGNLVEKIDAKNQKSRYVYDDAGRLAEIRYYAAGDHTTAAKTVTFAYDAAGNLTGYNDGTTSASYSYDDADRKVSETVNYPGFSLASHSTYYKNGLKESFTGPDGIDIGYLYDANNQLTGVQIPNAGMFSVNDYTWNRPAVETLPGGATRQYDYDPLMRVSDITAKDPGANNQLNYSYTYDKVDNITAKATGHGDYRFSYDNLYRLTDTDNPDGQADEAFDYDGVGNRLAAADTSGTWHYNANNELEGFDNVTFDYDANGNLIEKNANGVVTKFFYNLEDRLERVEDSAGNVIATYYYDPFGRRLWKEVAGSRTCFYYSDEGLVGEYNAAGAEIKTYGWKPGSTWSTDPLFMKQGGQYYWYHNDHLGTPQMMTTTSGAVVWSAKYTSFGKATVDPSSTIVNPLRFPGQYEDVETGLHYNLHRYYSANLGRYLKNDPIGLDGGINLYVYVSSEPVNWFDPYGLEEKRPSTPKIRRDWEKFYDEKWPKDPDTGWNQDAHHKKPHSEGGPHTPENIEPKTRKDHINHHKEKGDYKKWGKKRKKPRIPVIKPNPPGAPKGPIIFFIDFRMLCANAPNDPFCRWYCPMIGGCPCPE